MGARLYKVLLFVLLYYNKYVANVCQHSAYGHQGVRTYERTVAISIHTLKTDVAASLRGCDFQTKKFVAVTTVHELSECAIINRFASVYDGEAYV